MRICLVLEGSYPYVHGGVSTWMHAYIQAMPQQEFSLWVIGAKAQDRGKFVYELPPNVKEVEEVFLDDALRLHGEQHPVLFTADERTALRELVRLGSPDWDVLYRLFQEKGAHPLSFLQSRDFMELFTDICMKEYPYVAYADAFHTMRSMLLPVLYLLTGRVPKADVYHAISTGYGGLLACLGGSLNHAPVLLTEHGIYTREREEEIIRAEWVVPSFKSRWIRFFYLLSEEIYRRAFRVSSLFYNARRTQIEMGCNAEKCIVIPNGVQYERFCNIPLKQEDGWVDIGAVVRLAPIKDVKTMIYAFFELASRVPNVRLHIMGGVVVTKYEHVKGEIPGVDCYEAGHPVPDENSFAATEKALELVQGLTAEDTVLFLLSGGGSALFEKPLLPGTELQDITGQLLASGADIVEMNTIRKRLSGVKGGRFAQACAPAQVFSIVLSDILGDPLDMIASGPAVPDTSTCAQALAIAEKYHLKLSEQAKALLAQETPKMLDNVTTRITGSVRELCTAAAAACREHGYEPVLLTDQLCCEAREAGSFLGSIVRTHAGQGKKLAYIAGGETVVHLTGRGLGGRNQELALAAAPAVAGLDAAVFSVGSDGTDGPTDAAGGYVDGDTLSALTAKGWNVFDTLQNNDAYHALKAVDGLIITGATGTNVNDAAVALVGEE